MQAGFGPRTLGLVLGVVVLPLFAAEQKAVPQIAAEIERIERETKNLAPLPAGVEGIVNTSTASLKDAAEALQAERIYLALERLLQGEDLFHGVRAMIQHAGIVKDGLPAFEAEWGKASANLAALSREVRSRNQSGSPAAVRALSETALGRTVPLLDGSRGFATATGPGDGLLYLGEAQGQAEFARFCSSLPLTRKNRRLTVRSLLPELLALQTQADAAFRPPRSIEQHPRFIALNSTLKLARELDSSKAYYGALYHYLEAVRHFAMLDAPSPNTERQAQLPGVIEGERKKLAKAGVDDSILELFLERAASQAAHPDGTAPTADEFRSAELILTRVLPAYAATRRPAAPLRKTKNKTIDVTLVRWPYT
jgi:hypothetical protein